MIDLSGTEVASYVYNTEVDLKKFNKKLLNGGAWKLLNKAGKRIATLWEDGSVRGK